MRHDPIQPRPRGPLDRTPTCRSRAGRLQAGAVLAAALLFGAAGAQSSATTVPPRAALVGAALEGGEAVVTVHDATLSAVVDRYWSLLADLGFAGRVVAVEAQGVVYRFTGSAGDLEAAFTQTGDGVTVAVSRV